MTDPTKGAGAATTRALPHPGSPEASAMLDSMLAEYNYPANPKNAARAGWEAANRWLASPVTAAAQPSGKEGRDALLGKGYKTDSHCTWLAIGRCAECARIHDGKPNAYGVALPAGLRNGLAQIEGDSIVIRLTADACAFAFANDPQTWEPRPPIVNKAGFLRDTFNALTAEREDGSTPLTDALDKAMLRAMEDGSDALDHDASGAPSPAEPLPGQPLPAAASELIFVDEHGNWYDENAEPIPAAPAQPPSDAVWEALQRLIENAATLGPASQEDALLVARWRGRFIAVRESGAAPAQPAQSELMEEAERLIDEHGAARWQTGCAESNRDFRAATNADKRAVSARAALLAFIERAVKEG